MMTYMMNKRIYTKPECFLLDEEIDMPLLQVISNTNNLDENNNPISGGISSGGNGNGTDLNGDGAREGSLFDEDYDF